MPRTLVAFHAHPDDESLLTAGVMAQAAAQGHRVILVVATAGEVGEAADSFRSTDTPESTESTESALADLGRARRAELLRSAEILGVHRVEFLGYRDSGLPDGDSLAAGQWTPAPETFAAADIEEAAERLAEILREEHADVLTTYDPNGGYGHPDHLQVHHVGHRAGELAGTPVVLEATINRDLMTMGISIAKSLGYEIPPDFDPATIENWFMPGDAITHAIDVTAFLDQKRASMQAHESQGTSALDSATPRSIAMFLALPEEYFSLAFGTEWFIERGRSSDPKADDIFATLGDATRA